MQWESYLNKLSSWISGRISWKNSDSLSPVSPRRCETIRNSSWWQMDVHFEKEHRPLWWLHPSSNNSFVGMFDVTRLKYSIIQTPILTRQHSPEETCPPLFSLSCLLFTLHVFCFFCFSLCFTLPVHSNRVSGPYKAACSSLRCCRSGFFLFFYFFTSIPTLLLISTSADKSLCSLQMLPLKVFRRHSAVKAAFRASRKTV